MICSRMGGAERGKYRKAIREDQIAGRIRIMTVRRGIQSTLDWVSSKASQASKWKAQRMAGGTSGDDD